MSRKDNPYHVHFSDPFDDWYYNAWYAPLWPLWLILIVVGIFLFVRWLV